MPADPKDLVKRFDHLQSLRRPYEQHWESLAEFMLPRKRGMVSKIAEGGKITDSQYDATSTNAGERLAAFIHGALTSTAYPFFALQMRNPAAMDVKSIADWVEVCGDRMLKAFSQSSWDAQCPEAYLDNIFFGTGSPMFIEEKRIRPGGGGFGGLRFTAMPLAECWLDENEEGLIDTVFRKYSLSARSIVQRWGDRASTTVQSLLNSQPYAPVEVLFAVYPRTDGVSRDPKAFSWQLPYAGCYVEYNTKTLLEEKGFHEFPAPTPRWSQANSDRVYGRGRGDTAYPDVRTLNESVRYKLMSLALALFPPMLKDSGIAGSIRWLPGAVHEVTGGALTMKPPIQPILNGARFDVAEVEEEKYREMIREAFHASLLQLPEKVMTAREALIRLRLLQQVLGSTLGRFKDEFLDPAIHRVFMVMLRAGALPPPPDELLNLTGEDGEIDIVYKGPLAMAQRTDDAVAIDSQVDYLLGLYERTQDPSVLDTIDLDEATWYRGEVTSVPSKVMRGKQQVEGIRTRRADAQAQAAAREERNQQAQEMWTKARISKAISESREAQEAIP